MLDFCYWANIVLIIFLWVFPNSEFLFTSVFAFSMGPLLLAVPIFRNSMVLHSFEKLTSVFIHLAPGISMYSIRYNDCNCWAVSKITPTIFTYLTNTLILYLLWALVYYIIIFQLTLKRCEKKDNTTLFSYHMENKNSFFYKFSGMMGEKLRPVLFMSMHLIFSLLTLIITFITLYSKYIQLFFLGITYMSTLWTAATYYIEIFSKNYELKLARLEQIKDSLTENKKVDDKKKS
jgi:hypothetical protein